DSRLQHCTQPGSATETVVINGQDLSLAEVVAVSCHRAQVRLTDDEKIRSSVNASIDFIKEHLDRGEVVYGINTGFGGSADARSSDFTSVQRGLIQHQNGAILLPADTGRQPDERTDNLTSLKSHALTRTVVRAAMLARCNSLMRGHSAVRLSVIDSIVALLNHDFVPVIPLRGSISASGDLMPLSYVAGALEGNHDIYLDCRTSGSKREILPASEALRRAGLEPTVMRPKEGLGLMNGTAVSVAAGTLALHETQYLILATQALTAMCTEALRGSADNFHPFISNVRPHSGQREVAENIWRQLKTSKLVVGKDSKWAGLYQDRYALRTASQWIGPQIEDLMLSTRQLDVELNSTTDNPLIDADEGIVHHGGNFQAVSVTSAMEKTRLALNMLGKLMFAQSSELINPMLNNILTPNLCFDEPGVSFTFKGVDINM
ncbi:phenylalanine ammonia-lyase, partial [Hortaea werneckii]